MKTISTISSNQLDKNEIIGKIGLGNNILRTPESLEEAETSNDLESSLETANDIKDNLNLDGESNEGEE